uniref:Uncharacterized protein n=1 Tax=Caenorhabditis tropicalis TaxID=1561998 RepID=A0A1I7T1R0_9PELO
MCSQIGSLAHPTFPQLWQKQKTKKCEGLSQAFLSFWLPSGKIYHRFSIAPGRSNTIGVPVFALASVGLFVLIDSALPPGQSARFKIFP